MGVKIQNLPSAAAPIDRTGYAPITQSDVTKKIALWQFGPDYLASNYGAVENGSTNDSAAISAAATAAGINPVVTKGSSVAATTLSAITARIESQNVTFSNRTDGELGLPEAQYPNATAMTFSTGEKFVQSYRNGPISGHTIYLASHPTAYSYDVVQGVLDIPTGTTVPHMTSTSGYFRNKSASTNAVAFFGCGSSQVNGANGWGMNTLLTDNSSRVVGALTGITLCGWEGDFNIMCTGTTVLGASIGGNSLSQPTTSLGFIVNSLGTGIQWDSGFQTMDGTVKNAGFGLKIGASEATGTSKPSQQIGLGYIDSGGVSQVYAGQVDATGTMQFSGDLTTTGYQVSGTNVVGTRKTGWSAATGTDTRTTFDTTTVTTAQLAERVKALLDDLISHGLIGT